MLALRTLLSANSCKQDCGRHMHYQRGSQPARTWPREQSQAGMQLSHVSRDDPRHPQLQRQRYEERASARCCLCDLNFSLCLRCVLFYRQTAANKIAVAICIINAAHSRPELGLANKVKRVCSFLT